MGSESYEKGDALFICITLETVLDSYEYCFKLLEKQRNETDILKDIISDLQQENKEMKQEIKKMNVSHKNEIDALKAAVTELQRKSQLELGSWQSSADKDTVKRWNHVIIAPTTANLFRLEEQETRIKVLKDGIYQISGDAHARGKHWSGNVCI